MRVAAHVSFVVRGMRNTLGDLNNHLFMQLERLNNEDIKGEHLQEEISKVELNLVLAGRATRKDIIGNIFDNPELLEVAE